jgi:hypothetical protein
MRTSSSTGTAREERRMEASRDLPQVLDRALQLVERALDERDQPAVARDLGLERTQGEERGREPLLGAVVKVALEPAALAVASPNEPEPRGLELLELRDEVAMEPVALHRDAEHRQERRGELRRLQQPRSMDQQADPACLVLDRGGDLAAPRSRRLGLAVDPDVAVAFPVPPVHAETRVLEDLAQGALHLRGRREVGDRIEDAPDRLEPVHLDHSGVVVARRPGVAKLRPATGARCAPPSEASTSAAT